MKNAISKKELRWVLETFALSSSDHKSTIYQIVTGRSSSGKIRKKFRLVKVNTGTDYGRSRHYVQEIYLCWKKAGMIRKRKILEKCITEGHLVIEKLVIMPDNIACAYIKNFYDHPMDTKYYQRKVRVR